MEVSTPERISKSLNVRYEVLNFVVAHIIWPGPGRIATLVHCNGAEACTGNWSHDIAPRIPKFREAVQKKHQLPIHWTSYKSVEAKPLDTYLGSLKVAFCH